MYVQKRVTMTLHEVSHGDADICVQVGKTGQMAVVAIIPTVARTQKNMMQSPMVFIQWSGTYRITGSGSEVLKELLST